MHIEIYMCIYIYICIFNVGDVYYPAILFYIHTVNVFICYQVIFKCCLKPSEPAWGSFLRHDVMFRLFNAFVGCPSSIA